MDEEEKTEERSIFKGWDLILIGLAILFLIYALANDEKFNKSFGEKAIVIGLDTFYDPYNDGNLINVKDSLKNK